MNIYIIHGANPLSSLFMQQKDKGREKVQNQIFPLIYVPNVKSPRTCCPDVSHAVSLSSCRITIEPRSFPLKFITHFAGIYKAILPTSTSFPIHSSCPAIWLMEPKIIMVWSFMLINRHLWTQTILWDDDSMWHSYLHKNQQFHDLPVKQYIVDTATRYETRGRRVVNSRRAGGTLAINETNGLHYQIYNAAQMKKRISRTVFVVSSN